MRDEINLTHMVIAALIVALLPSLITAQAATRVVTLPTSLPPRRHLVEAMLVGLGTLTGQTGGILSAMFVLERIFALPGLADLLRYAMRSSDVPLALALLSTLATLVLAGRLLAEIFFWLARLVRGDHSHPAAPPSPWGQRARRIWVALALALLVIPLGLVVSGLAVSSDMVSPQRSNILLEPPSADHPLGTDWFSRDILSMVRRSPTPTMARAGMVTVVAAVMALAPGLITSFFGQKQGWLFEMLSDLLLLPFDVLLMLPLVPAAIFLAVFFGDPRATSSLLFVALLLTPRAARALRTMLTAGPFDRPVGRQLLYSIPAYLLGLLYVSFSAVVTLGFYGVGAQPIDSTLGQVLYNGRLSAISHRQAIYAPAGIAALIGFCLYLAADAMAGFFHTKETMARLNE